MERKKRQRNRYLAVEAHDDAAGRLVADRDIKVDVVADRRTLAGGSKRQKRKGDHAQESHTANPLASHLDVLAELHGDDVTSKLSEQISETVRTIRSKARFDRAG